MNMNNTWRFTGPPENWITAISISAWALNSNNVSLWQNKIKPWDTIIFHSTKKSEFSTKAKSCVIWIGFAWKPFYKKNEHWWLQEIRDDKNYWPYVIPLKEIYLFSNISSIDFSKPIQEKSPGKIRSDVESIINNWIEISSLNKEAKKINPSAPNFPLNWSASQINPIYEELILNSNKDLISQNDIKGESILESRLIDSIDDKLQRISKDEILKIAREFNNSELESHVIKFWKNKIRKENQVQKRRVAKIEDYRCQVCGFRCEYKRKNWKIWYIIHVDHIIEKSEGGNEKLNNLWVLCPNCHSKKTYWVIKIDVNNKMVFEDGKSIKIRDNHLF